MEEAIGGEWVWATVFKSYFIFQRLIPILFFPIWAEETGFFGALLVIVLYGALIGRILWVGRRAERDDDGFPAYICYGVALIFSGQAFVNMGVSSGLLPTKGLTLPFISYGGSSLIMSCIMLAGRAAY
jgi:cell division protein FtsW